MKQIRFIKNEAGNTIDGTLRIIGKYLFFKYKDNQQNQKVIQEFKNKGINIETSKDWIKVDLLSNHESIKLGEIIIESDEDANLIEDKLYSFYKGQYNKMGFVLMES